MPLPRLHPGAGRSTRPGGSGGADAAASGKAGSAEDVDYRVVDDEEKNNL